MVQRYEHLRNVMKRRPRVAANAEKIGQPTSVSDMFFSSVDSESRNANGSMILKVRVPEAYLRFEADGNYSKPDMRQSMRELVSEVFPQQGQDVGVENELEINARREPIATITLKPSTAVWFRDEIRSRHLREEHGPTRH